MYLPSAYEETRPQALHDVLTRHPLGMLVTHGSQIPRGCRVSTSCRACGLVSS